MSSFIRIRSRRRNCLGRLRGADRARDRKAGEIAERTPLVFRMPYGKHRGLRISNVPGVYLTWIVHCEGHQLKTRARRELQRRRKTRKQGSTL